MTTPEELIARFRLEKHPEGGYYRENYRAAGGGGGRSFSTAVYFLLPAGHRSRLHRLKSDEVWHFYAGGPLTVAQFWPDGRTAETAFGSDLAAGQKFQHVVPAGCWFGAYPGPGTEYSFVGCTVAPGFDFADFELADRAALLREFPGAGELIEKLTDAVN